LSWSGTLLAGLTVVIASAAGFALAVLPVLGKMPTFFVGLGQLLAHENVDPLSVSGRPAVVRLAAGFAYLYHAAPAMFLGAGLAILLAGIAYKAQRNRMQEQPELWALALGLILQITVLTMAIIEHPVTIYLLSLAATIPVLLLVEMKLLDDRPTIRLPLGRALMAIILVGFVVAFANSVSAQQVNAARIAQIVERTKQSREGYARALGRLPSDLFVLWSYRSYAPCFSLWFGNDSTGRAFRKEIGDICYRQYELNIWSQKVVSSQGVSDLADAKWDMIIGCEDGFESPALISQQFTETFPSLRLECGSLKIAYYKK
jgi:hypothetical protein